MIHRKFASEIVQINKDSASIMKTLIHTNPEEAGKLHNLLKRLEPIRKYHFNKVIK